jgi:hypothetical protein
MADEEKAREIALRMPRSERLRRKSIEMPTITATWKFG